jgi:hypothetical protein
MRLRGRMPADRSRREWLQTGLLTGAFASFGLAIVAGMVGWLGVALTALGVAFWGIGGLQIAFPETMVRISRNSDWSPDDPAVDVNDIERKSKQFGGFLLVVVGSFLVFAQRQLLALV